MLIVNKEIGLGIRLGFFLSNIDEFQFKCFQHLENSITYHPDSIYHSYTAFQHVNLLKLVHYLCSCLKWFRFAVMEYWKLFKNNTLHCFLFCFVLFFQETFCKSFSLIKRILTEHLPAHFIGVMKITPYVPTVLYLLLGHISALGWIKLVISHSYTVVNVLPVAPPLSQK